MGRPPGPRIEVECANCACVISMPEAAYKRIPTGRVFCNDACRRAAGSKPRRGETVRCATCGADVYRRQSQPDKRFCSRVCLTAASKRTVVGKCLHCEREFETSPSTNKKYCDKTCESAARTTRSIGRDFNGKPVIKDYEGYLRIWLPEHPRAGHGRVLEHRYVVEQSIGRRLRSDEHVHHINGVKDDNRLENLEVLSNSEHSTLTNAETQAALLRLAEYERRFGPLE